MSAANALYEQFARERGETAYFMRRLYNKNLTTSSGGNLSVRVGSGHVLLTPSALDKGELTAEQILLATLDGENLTPHLKPTIEAGLHFAVYRARSDVRAVVHAHPVHATAFACADGGFDTRLTSEMYTHLPEIAVAPFATPGSDALARGVAEALERVNGALMRNHGVCTVGDSLYKAFDLMESIETAAKTAFVARVLASPGHPVRSLGAAECRGIDAACGRTSRGS